MRRRLFSCHPGSLWIGSILFIGVVALAEAQPLPPMMTDSRVHIYFDLRLY